MTVAAAMVRALVDATDRGGVPRSAFLRCAGLDDARLADPFGRFQFEEYEALQLRAIELTGDEALGLHVVEGCSEAAFDLLPHLLPLAPTLRDAFMLCGQFCELLVSGSQVVLEEAVDTARLKHTFPRLSPLADRWHAELAMVGLSRLLRTFAGRTHRGPKRVCFEHRAPAERAEYRRQFGGAERFGQPYTGLEFERALLDAPHVHQQPRTYALLLDEAHRQMDAVSSGPGQVERVKRYLLARSPSRVPKMHVAARDLGMSARSLRRRLMEEGTCYRNLVNQRLEQTASHVLRSPGTSVQEAARATGFADTASFDRAFKKWTGLTPTAFRHGLGA